MLTDKLRDGAHGKVFKILFWIIILSFIFAGVGNYLIPKLDTDPVEVGDIKIKAEQWNAQYQDQARMMQNQYGPQVNALFENPEYVKALRMQVLERMIDNVALNSVTYKEGIRVGDEQVKAQIRREPAFQKDGKFDNNLYLATIRNMGSSPDYFAEQLRVQLASDLMIGPLVVSGSVPYSYEVSQLLDLFTQERTADLYSVDLKSLGNSVSVTDEDAKKFYDENRNLFKKPASVKFTYILLNKNDLKKDIKYTDADLENFYDLNQSDFVVPQKREASQILIKASTEGFEAKAKEALAKIKSGESFEKVGLEYSDDTNFKNDHGALGLLEKGSLSDKLDIALFGLAKVGDVSEVVIDNSGAHILKLDGITEEFVPKLADIREDVAVKYVDSKALELYMEKSAKLTDTSFETPDSLDVAADTVGVAVADSGIVSLGDRSLQWPLGEKEVQKVVFSEDNRTSNVNTPVVSLGNEACIVMNVNEYNEETTLSFNDVEKKASDLALAKAVSEKAHSLLESVKENEALPEGVSVKNAVKVIRGDAELDPYLVSEIFALPAKEGSVVISSNKGVPTKAVLKGVNTQIKAEEADGYKNLISAQLTRYKQEKTNHVVHVGAREISEVKYNEDGIKIINQQMNSSAE
ncbi:MAG: SurA N-terminal domain-containing protein [Succinivibrio sp.]